jgi:hypothetical protein
MSEWMVFVVLPKLAMVGLDSKNAYTPYVPKRVVACVHVYDARHAQPAAGNMHMLPVLACNNLNFVPIYSKQHGMTCQ